MSGVAQHLVRRALDRSSEPGSPDVAAWKYAILIATALVFVTCLGTIHYIYQQVVMTLVMVESHPTDSILVSTPAATSDKKTTDIEAEVVVAHPEPLPLNLFRTMGDLRSRAGRMAPFRGVSLWVFSHMMQYSAGRFFTAILPLSSPWSYHLGAICAALLVGRLRLTWTHVVVSEPSSKWWSNRMPSFRVYKSVLAATAIFAVANQLQDLIVGNIRLAIGLDLVSQHPASPVAFRSEAFTDWSFQVLNPAVASLLVFVFLQVPARLVLTRVQASTLPDEDETIVPFDRSFDGKVVPAVLGGSGALSLKDAWNSMDWKVGRRLAVVYAKIVALELFMMGFFAAVFVAEVVLLRTVPKGGH
ncbi:MAG: hypothetical protein M1837_002141 [Sclerophora amabilis]|nr:MAG: hypothetical protein M1837_002141 [Sclerophora amabilis]